MELTVNKNQNDITIKISGEIDEHGAQVLKEKFVSLDTPSIKKVIFDFASVTHIGSAGIGKLLLFYKDVALRGGQIHIINLSDTIYNLFLTLKLESVFQLEKG